MSVISDFHNILADFTTSVSVVEAPADWIDASNRHVLATMQLVGVSGEEYAKFAQTILVYPRLLIHVFAHVKFCTSNPRIMGGLLAELSKWNEYDDLTQLLSHQSISRTLWAFLGQDREAHGDDMSALSLHSQNSHPCVARIRVEKLLNLDITAIAAHILLILRDSRRRALLLAQQESKAQSLLDLLQMLLDFTGLDPRLRSPIVSALVKLSKNSGLYPECLILRGVQKMGQDAVAGGSFGDIWKGEFCGHTIAIKVMRVFGASDVDKVLKAFSYEAVLWRQLCHPNLLPFYGIYRWSGDGPRICLISPWMMNGNVIQYLEQSPHANRVSLLSDVALGLQYLHSRKPAVIHGDLKGSNILITSSLRACITDFGLARLSNDSKLPLTSSSSMASSGGTLRWQAPELLMYEGNGIDTHNHNSLATDIYAFGCVCYEIFVGRPPFHDLMPEYRVISAVVNGHRPPRPSLAACGLDDAIWDLIEKCWKMNPAQRHSARDVVRCLLSGSAPSRSPRHACHWDETIMSRLRSTLAGHFWSGPTHPLELTQDLNHDVLNTQPSLSSAPPTSPIPSRVVAESYDDEWDILLRPAGRTPCPATGGTSSLTGTTLGARNRLRDMPNSDPSPLSSATPHQPSGPMSVRTHLPKTSTPRARRRIPGPPPGSTGSLTRTASHASSRVIDENYRGSVAGYRTPSPTSSLPTPSMASPPSTCHDRLERREGSFDSSGPKLKRSMDDSDTLMPQKQMGVDNTSPTTLTTLSNFSLPRQASSSQLHTKRSPENIFRGVFQASGVENVSPPTRLRPEHFDTENRFDLIGVQVTYTSKKRRILRFL